MLKGLGNVVAGLVNTGKARGGWPDESKGREAGNGSPPGDNEDGAPSSDWKNYCSFETIFDVLKSVLSKLDPSQRFSKICMDPGERKESSIWTFWTREGSTRQWGNLDNDQGSTQWLEWTEAQKESTLKKILRIISNVFSFNEIIVGNTGGEKAGLAKEVLISIPGLVEVWVKFLFLF